VSAHTSPPAGRLEQRAADIEATVGRISARLSDIPVTEMVLLRLMVVLGREISALLEQVLRPHDLNQTDFRSLMMLFSQPDGVAHPSELCTSVAQSPANMTRVADSLNERGLITRVGSAQDRRRTILRITPAGEALVRALVPQTAAYTRALFEPIPVAARKQLLGQLQALLAQLDHSALPAAASDP